MPALKIVTKLTITLATAETTAKLVTTSTYIKFTVKNTDKSDGYVFCE